MNPEGVPQELRDLTRWVMWRREGPDGSKIPYQVNGVKASSTDAATWTTFDKALLAEPRFSGIGFVLGEPYCGVDLDDCIDPDGNPYPRAAKLVALLDSYTEVSPSGKGLHVIVRAKKPGTKSKSPIAWTTGQDGAVEMYDNARYFCMTGEVSPDAPASVNDRQEQVGKVYSYLFPALTPRVVVTKPTDMAARCHAYLLKCPESISGQNGHDRFLRVACECMRFGLSDPETWAELRWWSDNKSGGDPWNDREIAHKIESARSKVSAEGGIGIRAVPHLNGKLHAVPVVIPTPPKGASAELDARIDRIVKGEWKNAPFCWRSLTVGTQALLPGTVTLICGEPGSGKSFFMLSAALGWLELGVPFAVFMLEEDRTYHLHRARAMLCENAHALDMEWVKSNAGTLDKHAAILDKLGECIYDAPEHRVSLTDLADWYEKVAPTVRVAVIDPVTAASAGEKRWLEDGAFVERIKTIARKTETSLIIVTHPRIGRKKSVGLDDLAGGADYARFTQTVLVLSDHDPTDPVRIATPMGTSQETVNRVVHIRKARNGVASGRTIAFRWHKSTLAFEELGIVAHD